MKEETIVVTSFLEDEIEKRIEWLKLENSNHWIVKKLVKKEEFLSLLHSLDLFMNVKVKCIH